MFAWLVASPAQVAGYLQAASHALLTPSGSALVAVAAVALTGMLVAFLAHSARIAAAMTAHPLAGRVAALQEKSWAAVFQRQLNPDAAGHVRPRAPAAAPAAA
jgi:Family of unknown function (DUF6412)